MLLTTNLIISVTLLVINTNSILKAHLGLVIIAVIIVRISQDELIEFLFEFVTKGYFHFHSEVSK